MCGFPFLLTLLACATAHSAEPVTVTVALVPRWWGSDTDPYTEGAKLIARLDTPMGGVSRVLYATPATASPEAAACVNGKIVLEGVLEPFPETRYADAVMTTAKVLSCSPSVQQSRFPLGADIALTGTLERRWWYGSPGHGATPARDRVNLGSALVFEDGGVVSVEMPREERADLLV